MLFSQDRALDAELLFSGSGNLGSRGTIYAKTGHFHITGSGNGFLQLVVGTFELSFSGNAQLWYDDQWFYQIPSLRLVE